MRLSARGSLFFLSLLLLSCVSSDESVRLDGFETPRIDRKLWSSTWWVSRSSGTDEGKLRVTVSEGDRRLYGKSGQSTERCELVERHRHELGRVLTYRFRLHVPREFPVADIRLVAGQWKQTSWRLWEKHSPLLAQLYRKGVFSLTLNNDGGRTILYETGTPEEPALYGGWTDFVYKIRMSRDNSGRIEVWIDGEKTVEFTGQVGYGGDGRTGYFRLGLYRDTMVEPMTVYFDDFSVEEREEW
ncbi:MAG: heparin lyase I family protein [Spirochaetales bacterium]|nr:heparin lyase I family protein [Spirochaetales bacterium]